MLKKIFAIVLGAALFAACAGPATPPAAPAAAPAPEAPAAPAPEAPAEPEPEPEPEGTAWEDTQLVVLTPAAAHGWIAAVIFFAEQKGSELGIPGFRLLASENVAEQASQLDELITQNVDAIVLFPHSDELTIPAQRVLDADIPLFVFNRNVHVDFVSRVVGSNLMIGEESARLIADGIGGSGVVATLAVPAVGSTNYERIGSFGDFMEDFPDIRIVEMTATAISIEEGLRVTTDMLVANPQIDAIFTIDDSLSIGALQAVREANRSDVQFINGSGGSQAYFRQIADTEDIFLFTATFGADMIVDTIQLAVEYLRDGRRDFEPLHIIPPNIVTRYNVEDFFAPGSPW
jgi:ribose transport system substrate-binding protein